MSKHLEPEPRSAKDFLEQILHSSALVKREWLEARQWAAVPVEQHGYRSKCELERLFHAMKELQLETALVIYPSNIDANPTMSSFCLSLDALNEAVSVMEFSYLITTRDCAFVYHYTNEDFTLFAGPRHFVELAIGASVEAGLWDWRQFCGLIGWNKAERNVYEDVAEWYERVHQSASKGGSRL